MFCTFGSETEAGSEGKAGAAAVSLAHERASCCRSAGPCVRPQSPSAPAEPPPLPRLLQQPLPAQGVGPPPSHRLSHWPRGHAYSFCLCLGPQVANRFARRAPTLELARAVPMILSSPLSPSRLPSGPQASPTAPGAHSLPAAELGARSSCWGLALRDSATSTEPSWSRGGESAPLKRRRGGVWTGNRGGRPPPGLRPCPPTGVLLISPAPPVAVIYLDLCAGIVLGRRVGSRATAAATKRGDYQPSTPNPQNPQCLGCDAGSTTVHLSKLKELHTKNLIYSYVN